ncbi:hypothetical protein ACFWWS_12735 [Streptomyces sp. NPDC059083]|uniref:hypothetical protein n=1 Tax=unclassified Streptomyces TaxID=2593676 RepID=UPI0036A7D5C3
MSPIRSPPPLLKRGLVVAVTLNGLSVHRLGRLLEPHRGGAVPGRLLVLSGVAATASQTGWWGACLICFVNRQGACPGPSSPTLPQVPAPTPILVCRTIINTIRR